MGKYIKDLIVGNLFLLLLLLAVTILISISSTWGYISWVSSLANTSTGVCLTFAITYWQSKVKTDSERRQLADALIAELRTLKELITKTISQIENIDTSLVVITITEDYFTVFNQSASKLGLLAPDTSTTVIEAYMKIKGLFDTARQISKHCDTATSLVNQETLSIFLGKSNNNQRVYQLQSLFEQQTIPLWDSFRNQHLEIIDLIEKAINMLKQK